MGDIFGGVVESDYSVSSLSEIEKKKREREKKERQDKAYLSNHS